MAKSFIDLLLDDIFDAEWKLSLIHISLPYRI